MAAELLEHLREQFLRLEQTSSEPSELLQQRRRALEALLQRGFPTTRHEDWKYTSLAPVLRYRYEVGAPASEELPIALDGAGIAAAAAVAARRGSPRS
jgi:Fe-S cluster assembly protein SufD